MWENLGKLVVAEGFKKWPKVQKIAQSGHTDCNVMDRFVHRNQQSSWWSSRFRHLRAQVRIQSSAIFSLNIYGGYIEKRKMTENRLNVFLKWDSNLSLF